MIKEEMTDRLEYDARYAAEFNWINVVSITEISYCRIPGALNPNEDRGRSASVTYTDHQRVILPEAVSRIRSLLYAHPYYISC